MRNYRSFLTLLLIVAFALRLLAALLTEFYPLFPEKYDSDSLKYHEMSSSIAEAWRSLEPSNVTGSFGHVNYARFMAVFYLLFGSSNIVAKIINSFIGALTLIPIWKLAGRLGGERGAKTTALLFAFWPSAIYFSSQNFRDTVIAFVFITSVYFLLRFLSEKRAGALLYSLAFSVLTGILRPEMMVFASFGLILLIVFIVKDRKVYALYAGAVAIVLLLLTWSISPQSTSLKATHEMQEIANDAPNPLTMALSNLRKHINKDQMVYPETALFSETEFRGWLDVLMFLPKGIFHILFMPLPLLYPINGNIGRMLASVENLFLLTLTVIALRNFILEKKTIEMWYIISFLLFVFSVHALTEPDLGSAMRHKITYLPLIFSLVGLRHPSSSRWPQGHA